MLKARRMPTGLDFSGFGLSVILLVNAGPALAVSAVLSARAVAVGVVFGIDFIAFR